MEVNNIIDYNSLTPQQQIGRAVQANNEWSAQQAAKQMDFQREMSDTAHQREVADLKAAGLNPVLSAKLGGASTPSGAMGTTDTSGTSALVDLLTLSMETANSAANAVSGIARGNGNSANGANILGASPKSLMFKNPRTAGQIAWNGLMQMLDSTGVQLTTDQVISYANAVGIKLSEFIGNGNSGSASGTPILGSNGVGIFKNNMLHSLFFWANAPGLAEDMAREAGWTNAQIKSWLIDAENAKDRWTPGSAHSHTKGTY